MILYVRSSHVFIVFLHVKQSIMKKAEATKIELESLEEEMPDVEEEGEAENDEFDDEDEEEEEEGEDENDEFDDEEEDDYHFADPLAPYLLTSGGENIPQVLKGIQETLAVLTEILDKQTRILFKISKTK